MKYYVHNDNTPFFLSKFQYLHIKFTIKIREMKLKKDNDTHNLNIRDIYNISEAS